MYLIHRDLRYANNFKNTVTRTTIGIDVQHDKKTEDIMKGEYLYDSPNAKKEEIEPYMK